MKYIDKFYIKEILDNRDRTVAYFSALQHNGLQVDKCGSFPLDDDVYAKLKEIYDASLVVSTSEYDIFQKIDEVKTLWLLLIQKSIECLRFFDQREPFKDIEAKKPLAYGLGAIDDYYKKYNAFEKVLYGGTKYYRDHVVHVFRVWLLGVYLLMQDNFKLLTKINVNYRDDLTNSYEKISIWTLIALTHDLGYPLEKSSQIINVTRDMMSAFVASPQVSVDFAFHGVQNSMNDFVLRFISSKMIDSSDSMKRIADKEKEEKKQRKYVARLQPKYYFKFQKSLEQNKHGILSSIIIYKLLLFFLESDYSINEDYLFTEEESRQFYIRREVLRAIASHTCSDIYQMNQLSFAFLLIMCDDAQEWGRKDIGMLYTDKSFEYEYGGLEVSLDNALWTLKDKYKLKKDADIVSTLDRFYAQCMTYLEILRDGQDTKNRDFNFKHELSIVAREYSYILTLSAQKDLPISVELICEKKDAVPSNAQFVKAFMDKFKNSKAEKNKLTCELTINAISVHNGEC